MSDIVLLIDWLYGIDLFSCVAASLFNKLTYLLSHSCRTTNDTALELETRPGFLAHCVDWPPFPHGGGFGLGEARELYVRDILAIKGVISSTPMNLSCLLEHVGATPACPYYCDRMRRDGFNPKLPLAIITPPPEWSRAEYFGEYVCLSMCQFVREHISGTTLPIFTEISCMLPITAPRAFSGETLCTSGFMDDVTFAYGGQE